VRCCLSSIAIVGYLKKVKILALGEKVLFIKSYGSLGLAVTGQDWAMAGQRLCLPASAHPFLALKVCTDGVHNELILLLERLKGSLTGS
jgi:hypothetical protein